MKKRLQQYTVIPTDLYVPRTADRQLQNAIMDMGRPGYILVARQMGKTNLLLHAKRIMESPERLFAYVDLSKPFGGERECFRHIIDTVCASRPNIFTDATHQIFEQRKSLARPTYKEHEDELLAVIRVLKGDLVIVLDEIDSLLKIPFSDNLFAQIRSIYFSRVTYSEYSHLTYVLSGVVEPNDIIKNKNISPFNIGEKIYLDDFSWDESLSFLHRANLSFSDDVTERLFYWANGNPRITWDLCSELENLVLENVAVTVQIVDETVTRLYLSDFNRPPVDHIRQLLTDDRELRRALGKLRFGSALELTDEEKNKLYLAGIVNSASLARPVKIKNQVINFSLSDKWLRDLDVQIRGLLRTAEGMYQDGEFKESLALFKEFLIQQEFPPQRRTIYYHYMGRCAVSISEYTEALDCFAKSNPSKTEDPSLYYLQILSIAICNAQISQIKESVQAYESIISANRQDTVHANALINLGIMLIKYTSMSDFKPEYLFQTVLSILPSIEPSLPSSEAESLLCAAHFYLGIVYKAQLNRDLAIDSLQSALSHSSVQSKPRIIFELSELAESTSNKQENIAQTVELVISNNLYPTSDQYKDDLALERNWFASLVAACHSNCKPILYRLTKHLLAGTSLLGNTPAQILYQASLTCFAKKSYGEAGGLILEALSHSNKDELSQTDRRFAYGLLILRPLPQYDPTRYFRSYLKYFNATLSDHPVSFFDFQVVARALQNLYKSRSYDDLLKWTSSIIDAKPNVSESLLNNYALIYHYEMITYSYLSERTMLKKSAHKVLEFLSVLRPIEGSSSIVDDSMINRIKEQANYILSSDLQPTVRGQTKISRNAKVSVQYVDGTIKSNIKYKIVEHDISSGACAVISL